MNHANFSLVVLFFTLNSLPTPNTSLKKYIFKKKNLMIIIRKLFKETEICFNEPNWLNNSLTEGRGGIVSKLSKRPS